ncbi:hypothetical protein HPB52_010966 [Rhipicephalus sanguineus]|uniref:Uncharacterized protein n=1 Tax=Rhipicephalus sanguineus TaxID=34632 RepID=A0A9D4SQ71_RHISA|nr:hypothetical protein HPB52_010966 [Rhipicephalus sanguineus]
MPCVQRIRRWLKAVDGWPGFTPEVLNDLKTKHANATPRERMCSVLLDGMSIKKACELDLPTGRLIGYPDLGEKSLQPSDPKNTPLATDALVFMVVGLTVPWKMPFGYFLNAGLSGEVLRDLLLQALQKLQECGLIVMAVICDCLGANVSMAKLLGCRVHEQRYDDLMTTFEAFDFLNSSSPISRGFKAPLRPSTFRYQKEAMEQAGRELMALQLATGKPVVQDSRRMSVISLAFTLKSVSHLAQAVFEADLCSYICTSRLNQDPLEMYFSCIRKRGGWNNNPSAAQFRHTYRRTLVHAQVASSGNANVLPQLQGIFLPRSQRNITCTQAETIDCEESMPARAQSLLEHDYADISMFSTQVACYIAGFIVRGVVRHLHCVDCAQLLVSDTKGTLLLTLKDNGGLIEASAFVHAALCAAERLVRLGTTTGHAEVEKLTLRSFQSFVARHVTMLNSMDHYREEPQHVLDLTKVIQRKYVVLRLRALARRITVTNRGSYLRHTLTKQVLFAHQ